MKKYFSILMFIFNLGILLVACQKKEVLPNTNETPDSNASILGRWNVVSMASSQGTGINEFKSSYTGQPDDYFEFKKNGYVDAKQNNRTVTMLYSTADNAITVSLNGLYNETMSITRLTSKNLILTLHKEMEDGQVLDKTYTFSR